MSAPLGRPRLHLRRTDSTNARALALALAGAPHGTLVTAGEQTAGRGRQGRSWVAPPGRALLLSLVLRDPPSLLPLAAAVAVAEVVGPAAQIKWPNDVLLGAGGGKVAGVLVQARPQDGWAVLGIGVNVALTAVDLDAIDAHAGTLGRPPSDVEGVLTDVLAALAAELARAPAATLARWRARDALAGRPVRWSGGDGVAAGIDDAGRLLVRGDDGRARALDAGEVHLAAPRRRDPGAAASLR